MPLALLSLVALTRLPIIASYSLTNEAKEPVLFVDVTLIFSLCTKAPTYPLTVTLPLLFSQDNFNKYISVRDYSKKKYFCNSMSTG